MPLNQSQIENLARIFDRISDDADWRRPIRAEIAPHLFGIADEACRYFTGAPLVCVTTTPGGLLRVECVGYRDGPCGP